MAKKTIQLVTGLLMILTLPAILPAQTQTGSIKGVITDQGGNPLPAVVVHASSPSLMGVQTYVTTESGAFRFPALPPGEYKLVFEGSGFKPISRENIIVRVGMVVSIDIALEQTVLERELTITAPSPTVDTESTKIASVIDEDILKNIPLARNLNDIVNIVPGAVSEGAAKTFSAVHGSTVRGNTYAFDGVNMNDPAVMSPLTNINFDVMEEIEIETAGHPASVGVTDGAYINVVTKSGGNRFSGGAILYYTDEGMNDMLWTTEQVKALGVAQPAVDKSWGDLSLTFGGPLLKDRLWFFTNGRYIRREQKTNFIPFTDILGRSHGTYDWTREETMGFAKLTSQVNSRLKMMMMMNHVGIYQPMYDQPGPRTPFISTMVWDHEKTYTLNGLANYILDQNTFAEIRVGYVRRFFAIPMQKEAQDLPWVDDAGDLYGPLTGARYNAQYVRKRTQALASITRFQDNWLGASHEFKGGVEFEDAYFDYDWWRKDNMQWYMDSRNPNNYYDKDRGRLGFWICGPESGSTKTVDRGRRIGAYLQDYLTIGRRLTVNLGLRFDRSWGWKPAVAKKAAGNPLAAMLGEKLVSPYVASTYPDRFPQGLNPWGDAGAPEWKNIIIWNSWAPRIGLSYDLFGNGKTALKASFSRYNEYLMIQYFTSLHPYNPRTFNFYWVDSNASGTPDAADSYTFVPADFRGMDPEFAKLQIKPGTTAPTNDEFIVGVWQELLKNTSLGVNFIYKTKKNILEDALYDPDSAEYWYHLDQSAAKKYWIPFTTTVPGTAPYPDETVTFYARSNGSPLPFTQLRNVPELKRKYWAMELILNKRMANRWQFMGSLVYSKTYGNLGGYYGASWGWSDAANSPNTFVNTSGLIDTDRPLQLKLMSTVQLPFGINFSHFFQYMSGQPWQRSVDIQPPAAWCAANNAYRTYYTVMIEKAGSRRERSWNSLDFRLEKEFGIGGATIGACADVINVLGHTDLSLGLNDVYRWDPQKEGANQPGAKVLNSNYRIISAVSGLRTLKLSLRVVF
ncbi:MAG TPA: carboxypeptidase regulatory-like domain-containing protein [Candidatus Aminicenantes bacterium]|nr:carboxypeptidase regulatory-like domain-containing protein [Candidatus Aminicenantes bacterium]